MTCGAPILDRGGKPLPEPCNLSAGHHGRCAAVAWELAAPEKPRAES